MKKKYNTHYACNIINSESLQLLAVVRIDTSEIDLVYWRGFIYNDIFSVLLNYKQYMLVFIHLIDICITFKTKISYDFVI